MSSILFYGSKTRLDEQCCLVFVICLVLALYSRDYVLTFATCIFSLDSRERNRMHAKMTRDRKKCFIATIEKTIDELESDVNRMRDILKQVSSAKFTSTVMHHVTPVGSPELSAKEGPDINDEEDVMDDDDDNSSVYSQVVVDGAAPAKKTKHGFSLND